MASQDFIDESKSLKKTITDIEKEIDRYKDINKSLESSLDRSSIVDYDDADNYRFAKKRYDNNNESIASLTQIKKSPYFGRLDLEDTKGEADRTLYIGKEGLFIDGNQRIVDWRTDIGNLFYKPDLSSKFSVNNYDYRLILKREMDIKESELHLCKTIYDAYDFDGDAEVVDSFLIEVLKDKRRDKKVSDIIRTIQSNQNEILRQPVGNNFVVQGCAGSGKTMILLHRLSYILYNKLMKPDEIRIITPNKYFDSQIDELSRELELNTIKRMTVDEYYCYLIEKLTGTKLDNQITPEYTCDTDYLKYVYSNKFVEDVNNEYKQLLNKLISLLLDNNVYDIFSKASYPLSKNGSDHLDALVYSVDSRIRTIEKEYAEQSQMVKMKKFNNELDEKTTTIIGQLKEKYSAEISTLNNEINVNDASINNYSAENKEIINNFSTILLDVNNKTIEIINNQKQSDIAKRADILVDYDKLTNLVSSLKSKIDSLYRIKTRVIDYNYVVDADNDVASYIIEKEAGSFDDLANLNKELENLSFLNFIKKNQINKQCDEIISIINSRIPVLKNAYFAEHPIENNEIELEKAEKAYNQINDKVSKLTKIIDSYDTKLNECKENINKLKSVNDADGLVEVLNTYDQNETRDELLKVLTNKRSIMKENNERNPLYNQDSFDIYKNEISDLCKAYMYNRDSYTKLSVKLEELNTNLKRSNESFILLSDVKTVDDLMEFLNNRDDKTLKKATNDFTKLYNKYVENRTALQDYENEKTIQGKSVDVSELTIDELTVLKSVKAELPQYDYKVVEKNIEDKFIRKDSNTYRHNLYSKLLISSLFYNDIKIEDKMICFDEAQDLSASELNLFISLNIKKAIYNLYGDTNQAVNDYECISDWREDLKNINNLNIYELNQNYRNSSQITEYCNKVFKTNTAPIGIKGDNDVHDDWSFSKCLQTITDLSTIDSEKRCVIIYSERDPQTVEFMRGLSEETGLKWNSINEQGVSVMPVRLCKGLEFDAVLVMDYEMDQREKYISYTRALDNLIICKAKLN